MLGQSLLLKSTENKGRSVQVGRFLAAREVGSGRLIFALDATASRAVGLAALPHAESQLPKGTLTACQDAARKAACASGLLGLNHRT
jgi:hypothetical protein